MRRALGLLLAAAALGCGPRHVAPFTPRQRVYHAGVYAEERGSARAAPGSLFSDTSSGLLEDTRARKVGDFVTIQIDERADASGGARTNLTRESEGSSGASALLGIIPALKRAYPNVDPEKLVAFASQAGFTGTGDTTRNGQLRGSLAVRIAREMPNGDFFLEGTKVVLINNEEYHLYVSGLARRADIAPDNTLSSSRIADAQIEFTGRGDMADQQRKGFFARMFDSLNPF